MEQTKERILWVDFAKVIGIWLVYLGHSQISEFAKQYIYVFHMPLFFFISGYLEKKRPFGKSIMHTLKSLMIPYILIYLILYIPWLSSRIVFHKELFENQSILNELIIKPMIGIISSLGIPIENATVIWVSSWFVITLIYIKIVHRILIAIVNEKLNIYLLSNIPMLVLTMILKYNTFNVPLYIPQLLMAFPFFSIGYYIHLKNPLKENVTIIYNDRFVKIIISLILFLIIGFLSYYNGNSSIGNYGKNIVVYYIMALSGMLLVITISSFYNQENGIIKTISSGTLFIMAFELPFMGIVLRLSKLQYQYFGLIILGGVSCVALLLTVIPIKFVQKFIPIIIGGRK
jgi:fucose 4-O-acetylase-like acetyltransferase